MDRAEVLHAPSYGLEFEARGEPSPGSQGDVIRRKASVCAPASVVVLFKLRTRPGIL